MKLDYLILLIIALNVGIKGSDLELKLDVKNLNLCHLIFYKSIIKFYFYFILGVPLSSLTIAFGNFCNVFSN